MGVLGGSEDLVSRVIIRVTVLVIPYNPIRVLITPTYQVACSPIIESL